MTIKLTAVGVPNVVVEAAHVAPEAVIDDYVEWSLRVHNTGDLGIMAAGIQNYSGLSSVTVRWQGEEYVLPPSTTQFLRIYYPDAKPNCTRIEANGEIKFETAGTYKIRILGVHQENTSWFLDDHEEFTVEAIISDLLAQFLKWLDGLKDWQKIGLIAIPAVVGGIFGISRGVRRAPPVAPPVAPPPPPVIVIRD